MENTSEQILAKIRSVMKVERFSAPAQPELIDEVERALGVDFPDWLRTIYLACNGFLGPTGVGYLHTLTGEGGVREFTLFLRDEPCWPAWLDRAVIFGDNGLGGSITVHWGVLDGKLIEWCYGDAEQYTILDLDIYQLWAREQRTWDELR